MDQKKIYRGSMRGSFMQIRQAGFRPTTVIDVGAALGTFDLYEVFPESHHFLIEPVVENEPYLKNICHKLAKADYIIAAAVEKPGEVSLGVNPSLIHSSVSDSTESVSNGVNLRKITGITLDQICCERGYSGPYLVKIDVDGRELEVLAGALRILEETEYAIIEVSLVGSKMYDVINVMRRSGFVPYDIVDLAWRPSDAMLWQVDMAFVKDKGRFRQDVEITKTADEEVALNAHLKKYRDSMIHYLEHEFSPGSQGSDQ